MAGEWVPYFEADYGLYRSLHNAMPPLEWSRRGRPFADDYDIADGASMIAEVAHEATEKRTMFGFNLYTASGPGGELRFANKALLFNFQVTDVEPRSDLADYGTFTFEIVLWDLIADTKTVLKDIEFPLTNWQHDYIEEISQFDSHVWDAKTHLYYVQDNDYDDTGVPRIGIAYANFVHSFSTNPESGWGGDSIPGGSDGLAISYSEIPGDLVPNPEEITDPNIDPDPPVPPWPGPGPHIKIEDPIPIPDLPPLSAAGAGFITLYKLLPSEMQQFADECFDDSVWDILKHFFNKPADFVAGITICPFTPHGLTRWKPKFGTHTWSHSYTMVDDTFVSINCGSIHVQPFYNNCFDYSPYTKLTLWLPYIGYRDIDADDVMGHNINITYHCDCLSGACVAFISIDAVGPSGPDIPRVLYQFNGNVLTQVPVDSVSLDSMVSAAIGLAGAALTTAAVIATAGAAAPAAAAEGAGAGSAAVAGGATMTAAEKGAAMTAVNAKMGLTASTANAVQSMKPRTSHGGAMSSTAGYMGVQKPYLIKHIPMQSLPAGYVDLYGYPCNMGGKLGDFSGYTEVDDIQLNNIPATIPEISEIYQLLKGGIII